MKKLVLLLVLIFGLQTTYAQTKQISGKVTSASDGLGIPGVSVAVKGTTIGVSTNVDGSYSLNVPANAKTLIFSFVGMTSEEVLIGGKSIINVILNSESRGLDEVVVTALGIEVSKDKLGGSVTSIGNENLENTGESGVIQSLSGKTSGLTIVKNTGDPGAGAYIQIRGQNTITASLQPLVVIDGVPMINSSRGGDTDGVVQQSRMNDLNPNDIKSVEVLKGASAAAVWGTRAANGVIVITTKTGKNKQKPISVNLNVGFSWDEVSTEFTKQDTYGQGKDGKYKANRGESWGDRIADRPGGEDEVDKSGQYFESRSGKKYYPLISKNSKETFNDTNRDQVFRTGKTTDLGASVSLNTAKSATYISVSDWRQQGVIAGNSDYNRSTVRINYSTNPTDKLEFKLNSFFSGINSDRIQQGSNLNGLYLGYLRTSPDFDNRDYIGTYYNADGVPTLNSHRSYRRYLGNSAPTYNNPGWTIKEQKNTSEVQRFMINPQVSYKLLTGQDLSSTLTARYGYDQSVDQRNTFFPYNSASSNASGYYEEEWLVEKESTFEGFLRTMHNFEDINFSWIVGSQYNIRDYNYHGGSMSSFINRLDQIYNYDNGTSENITPDKYESHRKSLAGYLVANVDLYDQVFLEFTGRAEKSNAFKDVIFYPSASVAWQFSKLMNNTSNFFTFGKLRASVGIVGVEPGLYITKTDYVSSSIWEGYGSGLDASNYGGGLQRSTIQGNPDIEPEEKTEFEIGADLRFLNNYLTVNFTYYNNKTTGAIFDVDVPASTGFGSRWENAAEITNNGIELDITGTLVKTRGFQWDLLFNYSHNNNMVEDLKGVKSIFLNGFTGTSSRVVQGHPYGALWGGKFERDESGDYVLNDYGFPKQAAEEGVIGDPNPDWKGAIGTKLNYKGLSMNVLFEISQGGEMWAGSEAVLRHFGIAPKTANEVTLSSDVVDASGVVHNAGTTVRGNIHNFGGGDVLLNQAWYTTLGGGFGSVSEDFIHDASFVRLREVGVSYALPKKLLTNIKVESMSISLVGRNLALWSDFADEFGVDPETNLTGVSNGRGLDYFNNPGTKSYLVKLAIGF